MLMRIALVLAMVFAAWHFGRAQTQLADFRITIEPSASGVKLESSKGCAWKTLSVKCGPMQPCKIEVDQTGGGLAGVK
jgi:hypothetical protein